MNVLYFADTRFPIERANGVQTMATCQALAARGHDVTLAVRPDTARPPRDPFAFYGLAPVPSLSILTIPAAGGPRRRRLQFLSKAWRLSRAAPSSIVCTRDLGLAAFLLRTLRSPRLLYESHGLSAVVGAELPKLLGPATATPSSAKLRRLDRRDGRVWRRAAAYVCITRALADDLAARYGPRPDALFVVPDGAAAQPFAAPPAGPPAGRPIVAAYAGHLYPWKGVDVFVRALALAPSVHGLIVGGHPLEPDRARVEALVQSLGLSARVTFTGLVPPHEVAGRLAAAAILVLPNVASAISDRYTSPLKLFEYLWMGRPIVASDLTAIREVLTNRRTALLVPPGDAEALAGALEMLAAEPDLGRSLGSAARALAPDYTWARRAERMEAALAAAARA